MLYRAKMMLNPCQKKNLSLPGRCDFKIENISVKFKKIILELIIIKDYTVTPLFIFLRDIIVND